MYSLYLSTTTQPKSLNKKLNTNRFVTDRQNKAWDAEIFALSHGRRPKAPIEYARIQIVRHSHRMLDFDGLVGSIKPVVDALVTCGIILDDTWRRTGPWKIDQSFRPKNQGPLLEIWIQEASLPWR